MPHAGHFIMGNYCRFVLNTYVGGYIVSTVGELSRGIHAQVYDPKWWAENKDLIGDPFDNAYMQKFGYMEIGLERKFETMVFEAQKSKDKCCPHSINVGKSVDSDAYNTNEEAMAGHYKLCNKWSKK